MGWGVGATKLEAGDGGGGEAVNSSWYKKGMGGKCYAEMKLSKALHCRPRIIPTM